MRILLIESDSGRTDALTTRLEAEGHEVLPTDLGEEGASLVYVYSFDLILLSFELSDLPGMEVLRKMRTNARTPAPIIALSANVSTATTVAALNAGADDFVGIPLDLEVLLARIAAIIRRTHGHAHSMITIGNLAVDLTAKAVTVKGVPIGLTPREYQVLELLALRLDTVVTKDMLLDHLYGNRDEHNRKTIEVFIGKIRKKIGTENDNVSYIHTEPHRGYALRTPRP